MSQRSACLKCLHVAADSFCHVVCNSADDTQSQCFDARQRDQASRRRRGRGTQGRFEKLRTDDCCGNLPSEWLRYGCGKDFA